MFCTSCGMELVKGANFCGNCGAKVGGATSVDTQNVEETKVEIRPLATGLHAMPLQVTGIEANSDDTGELHIMVHYTVTNDTGEDFDFIAVRIQLLSASGDIVDEITDTHELTCPPDEKAALQSNFWGIRSVLMGSNLEKAQVIVSAVASKCDQRSLGQVAMPSMPYNKVRLAGIEVPEVLTLHSCCLWFSEPDENGECPLEFKALIQNQTALHLAKVELVAKVVDPTGHELMDLTGSDEIRPGDISTVNGNTWAPSEQLKNAKAIISLRTFSPVAANVNQCNGIVLSTDELEQDTNAGHAESDSGDTTQYLEGQLVNVTFSRTSKSWTHDLNNGFVHTTDPEILGDSKTVRLSIIYTDDQVGIYSNNHLSWFDGLDEEFDSYVADLIKPVVLPEEMQDAFICIYATDQDDYDLDADKGWMVSIGDGGEISVPEEMESEARDALVVNVLPYESGSILVEENADYAFTEAETIEDADFCGLLLTAAVRMDQVSPPDDAQPEEHVRTEELVHAPKLSDFINFRPGGEKVYFGNNLNAKKISAAMQAYASEILDEDVLVHLDITTFGGAKDGLIITNDHLYAKDLGQNRSRTKIKNIREIKVVSGFGSKVEINDKTVLHLAGTTKSDIAIVESIFGDISKYLQILQDNSSHY